MSSFLKRTLLLFFAAIATLRAAAQDITPALTLYGDFKPATILLTDGRFLKLSLANIFLRNSQLLYKSGVQTKVANMRTIDKVFFPGETFVRIDSLLACVVDTVGTGVLYRARIIDIDAFRRNRENNVEITSLDLGDMVGFTTTELSDEQDLHFPLINVYYYGLNGRYIQVHERKLKRELSKEKRRLMESVMGEKGFVWTDEAWLLRLLQVIQ